ncbi:MAG: hypothetical protein NC215_05995 [Ruminococcus sp.]|nr:hypothetical protein [Ruminococcus sp.]
MKKQTDMLCIKELARTFLTLDIETTPHSPIIVKHPFTDTGFVGFKDKDYPSNLLEDENALLRWREQMKSFINKCDSPHHIFMLLTKAYRMVFLKYAEPYMSQKDFSEILSDVWTETEAPHNDPNFTTAEFVRLFRQADPSCLMDEDEYEQFQGLDDTLTVYRGVTSYNADNVKALSWTLNPDTAEWFANRFDEDGTVYEAQIEKAHIYALFNGRNESEIVVDPKYLMDITEYQEQTNGFEQTM